MTKRQCKKSDEKPDPAEIEDKPIDRDCEKKPIVDDEMVQNRTNVAAQASVAFKALKSYVDTQQSKTGEKQPLFPEADQQLSLEIVLKKVSAHLDTKIIRLLLPHCHRDTATTSVCLFVQDKNTNKRDPDVDKDARKYREYLTFDKNVSRIDEIMSVTQLRREYGSGASPEAMRKLSTAYDVFLVDERVAGAVHKTVGKSFQKANKIVVPVDIVCGDVASKITKSLAKSVFMLRNFATRLCIPFGRISQPLSHLNANLDVLLDFILADTRFPGGLRNVRSLYIKMGDRIPSLPIYASLESANLVRLPTSERKYEKSMEEDFDGFGDEVTKVRVGKKGAVEAIGPDGQTVRIGANAPFEDEDSFSRRKRKMVNEDKINAKHEKRRRKREKRMKTAESEAAAALRWSNTSTKTEV